MESFNTRPYAEVEAAQLSIEYPQNTALDVRYHPYYPPAASYHHPRQSEMAGPSNHGLVTKMQGLGHYDSSCG